MREIPHSPVALYEVAHPFGTLIAETILASVHMRARKQAGHTGASNLIKALQNTLRGGGRPHTANTGPSRTRGQQISCGRGRLKDHAIVSRIASRLICPNKEPIAAGRASG